MADYEQGPANLAALRELATTFSPSTRPAAEVHASQLGLTYAPGARVVDQQTGSEGTVVGGAIVHGVKPTNAPPGSAAATALLKLPKPTTAEVVHVQLDSGDRVERAVGSVVGIPGGLTVPLEDIHLG